MKKGVLRKVFPSPSKRSKIAHKAIFIAYPKKTLENESPIDSSKCLDPLVKEYQDVF